MAVSHPCKQDCTDVHTTADTDYGSLIPDYAITQFARFLLPKLQSESSPYICEAEKTM